MNRFNTPQLTFSEREALNQGYREGKSHAFGKRCHLILLKSEGRDSKSVGIIVQMCAISVNHWVNRYKIEGLNGLATKPGRGRKALLSKEADQGAILAAVKSHRQRVDMAKAEWEAQSANRTVRLSNLSARLIVKNRFKKHCLLV